MKQLKTLFLEFYHSLNGNEQKTLWFGGIVFAIGFAMLAETIRPKSWWGWQETTGELVGTKSIAMGQFNASTTIFIVQYQTPDEQIRQGTFKMSPIVLATMKRIRVFYQQNTPSVFYVHNPTFSILAITLTVFGTLVLLAFYHYNRDRLNCITYE